MEGKVISRGELALAYCAGCYARLGDGSGSEGRVWCWGGETVCADDGVLRVRQIRGSAWRLCWVGSRFACSRRTRRSEMELGARWGCWSRFRAAYSRVLGVDVSLGIFGLLERNLRRYGGISETEDSCKQAPTSKPCAPAAIYTAFELRGADRKPGRRWLITSRTWP